MSDRKMIYLDDAVKVLEKKKDKRAKGDVGSFYNTIIQNDIDALMDLPSAQPEFADYAELKQWFIRMASYIDVLLVCPDEQKETLMGFISRGAEFMPWTERD